MEGIKEILGRYRNPLVLFIIFCGFFTVAALIVRSLIAEQDISPFIFGTGGLEMIILFVVMWPLAAIIGAILALKNLYILRNNIDVIHFKPDK